MPHPRPASNLYCAEARLPDATSSNSHFVWNAFDRVIVRQYSFPARNVIPFWESEMVLRAGRSFEKEKVENPFKIESVFF